MVISIPRLLHIDFTPLREPRLDYAKQTDIDPARIEMFSALAVHSDLAMGLVCRWLGREYTADWRLGYWEDLPDELKGLIPDSDLDHIWRILYGEVPSELNYHESATIKRHFLEATDHPSLSIYPKVMTKAINKEEHHPHVIPVNDWIVWMSLVCHHVPQMIIYKDDKGWVIWNGTSKSKTEIDAMNEITPIDHESEVTFGNTFRQFCTYIYNLRVSYPKKDIDLAFIDISSCFRWPWLFPDLVGAFGYLHDTLFFTSHAHIFDQIQRSIICPMVLRSCAPSQFETSSFT